MKEVYNFRDHRVVLVTVMSKFWFFLVRVTTYSEDCLIKLKRNSDDKDGSQSIKFNCYQIFRNTLRRQVNIVVKKFPYGNSSFN